MASSISGNQARLTVFYPDPVNRIVSATNGGRRLLPTRNGPASYHSSISKSCPEGKLLILSIQEGFRSLIPEQRGGGGGGENCQKKKKICPQGHSLYFSGDTTTATTAATRRRRRSTNKWKRRAGICSFQICASLDTMLCQTSVLANMNTMLDHTMMPMGVNTMLDHAMMMMPSGGNTMLDHAAIPGAAAMMMMPSGVNTMLDHVTVPGAAAMMLDHPMMPSTNAMLDHAMMPGMSSVLDHAMMALPSVGSMVMESATMMGGHLMMATTSMMLDPPQMMMMMMATGANMMLEHLVMAVGVGLPCTVMECGDVVYRSTLPRSNALNITTPGVLLTVLAASYLWATPGVAPGFWDMFLLAPLEQLWRPSYKKEDFILGRKLGEGAFGTVYKASFSSKQSRKAGDLVVKKASEFGAVEIWMNERVRRACPKACADYIYGFLETSSKDKGEEYWLVWSYEGDATLFDLMTNKEFPYNVEEMILGRVIEGPRSLERESRVIQTIMKQILSALQALHKIGIVHRDIKPQNIIFSQESRTFKIIDLGAAADLRVGINYVPKEFLLDPRYAAPEQYIMSTQTPSAPPAPVATALSPVLWQMNSPDRFDIYSAGLIFLQMAFPSLRTDSALIQFNRQLKRCDYEMAEWRKLTEPRANADLQRGFDILDLDGGVGWELLLAMVVFKGRQRISATDALSHPYFDREGLMGLTFMQKLKLELIRAARQDPSEAIQWVYGLLVKSGTTSGGFTEIQLADLKESKPDRKSTFRRNALASVLQLRRKVARTINETMDDMSARKKEVWWSRWIPRDN